MCRKRSYDPKWHIALPLLGGGLLDDVDVEGWVRDLRQLVEVSVGCVLGSLTKDALGKER